MASRRMLKAAEAIREVVSMAILTEVRDPRVQNVTVTSVEVAPDMRNATVYISVLGDERQQELCLRGLANSAGFLQSKVAKRIDTRYTPRLTFEIDTGVKKSLEVSQILQQIAEERKEREQQSRHLEDSAQDTTSPAGHAETADHTAKNSAEEPPSPI